MERHGPQGWWPINGIYHKDDYSYPHNEVEIFEICAGAILTQNTSWKQVEIALENLKKLNLLDCGVIVNVADTVLKDAIRPAGYFNQKAKKLKFFSEFFRCLNGRTPTREELLNVWGIGPESADSILLYGYSVPTMVIDTYTKRLFFEFGIIDDIKISYGELKSLCESELQVDLKLFQEFHALIVQHCKSASRVRI